MSIHRYYLPQITKSIFRPRAGGFEKRKSGSEFEGRGVEGGEGGVRISIYLSLHVKKKYHYVSSSTSIGWTSVVNIDVTIFFCMNNTGQ